MRQIAAFEHDIRFHWPLAIPDHRSPAARRQFAGGGDRRVVGKVRVDDVDLLREGANRQRIPRLRWIVHGFEIIARQVIGRHQIICDIAGRQDDQPPVRLLKAELIRG